MELNNRLLLHFENVTLANKENQIIYHNINFKIFENEIIFIVGHKDKDRTLILYSILGLIKPEKGKITVFNNDLAKMNQAKLLKLRKKIGYVFPEGGLIKSISIEDNLALPLQFNSELSEMEIHRKTAEIIRFFKLNHVAKNYAWGLDNIIEKKTVLARSIINNPLLLLIDEPTCYLEECSENEMKELIDQIINSAYLSPQSTIIITTDNESWAKEYDCNIFYLKNGNLEIIRNRTKYL